MPIMVRIVLTTIQAARQIIEVPQMTSPQERQLREQRQEVPQMTSPQKRQLREQKQEVKGEHETWFAGGEEHLHFNGDVY
jgi:hypothetical protein